MFEIRQQESNQLVHYVYGTRSGKTFYTGTAEGALLWIQARRKALKNHKRNINRRAVNEVLRTLTGTNAAAARRDMGLSC